MLVALQGGARFAAAAAPLLLRGARVIDARGARGPLEILLRDGRIAAMAAAIPRGNARVLDLAGATVVPGLIDAHVHLMEVPGASVRGDGASFATGHPGRLADPLVRATVPRPELRTARDPLAWDELGLADVAKVFPYVPRFILRRVAHLPAPPSEAVVQHVLRTNLRAARALHAAGVPLAIGSDAGNSFTLTQFHGVTTLRELELLAEAGLSPADVIAAATIVPARLLGLEDELGTVEVGKRADLAVLLDDPSRDLRAFRTIAWTIRDGVARTPAQWMGRRSR